MKPSLEQVVKLIFSTLPQEFYRDFHHRFKLKETEVDDASLQLSIDILGMDKVRVYYYGSNSRSYALHEEYWNGEQYEQFTDGGSTVSLGAITKGRLQSWFYRVFKLDATAGINIDVAGLNKAATVIFSVLPNEIVHDGDAHALSLLISHISSRPAVCDIRYKNVRNGEYIWLTEGSPIGFGSVTSELLKKEYGKFKP